MNKSSAHWLIYRHNIREHITSNLTSLEENEIFDVQRSTRTPCKPHDSCINSDYAASDSWLTCFGYSRQTSDTARHTYVTENMFVCTVMLLAVQPCVDSVQQNAHNQLAMDSRTLKLTVQYWCHYSWTWLTPCSAEHFLKCILAVLLRLYSRSHKPQENCLCLYSQCTGRCCLKSSAVQKHFGHSLQTYGFTASCRWTCTLRLPLRLNFFWQMSHVNQVPSLCDFSRCVLSWSSHVKQSEQCLHEYGFASVWIRTWRFSWLWILNRIPQ